MHDLTLPIRHPVFLLGILMLVVLIVPALFQRFKMPGIVGLILTGAVLGPHGSGLLYHGEGIQILSKAGLLYLMFWAGLELNMTGFLRNKHKSLVFGVLTFLLPLLLGGLSAYYFLEFKWAGAMLLASMFSTHTLISYPIVTRLRVSRNEAVAITVGGTIITDTLALMMLAVITNLEQGSLTGFFWIALTIKLSLFAGVVFGIIPKVARWFFQRVESDLTYQYVFVLTVLFISALLAELAGIEGIIGAFTAGLVLNRLIPHSSPLMERIDFMGQAFFIPAFLFSVGMLVNLGIFFSNRETIIMALLLTAVALITKWLAAFVVQHVFHYSGVQRNLIFGLSSSHAAATIAIILIGYQIKLFDETVLNAIILLILITCMVSSFVTDHAARRLASEGEVAHALDEKPQRILVPYSNPGTVARLLDFAFLLKLRGQSEPIRPLAVILDEKDVPLRIEESRRLLEPALRQLGERQQTVAPVYRVDVNAASGILRAAIELPASDILIGWKPTLSKTDRLFGTLYDHLMEESSEHLFVVQLMHAVSAFQKVRLILPENCHYEVNFNSFALRIENICRLLNAPLLLLASEEGASSFKDAVSKNFQKDIMVIHITDSSWFRLHDNWQPDVLTIILSARQGCVSYESFMEKLPDYLTEHFTDKSFVLAFPAV